MSFSLTSYRDADSVSIQYCPVRFTKLTFFTLDSFLEQLVHASSFLGDQKVRNVVFMGMGEPLNNYENVIAACRAMIDPSTWSMKHHHVTISTVGIVSKIYRLTRDLPLVSLALSLHAPNQSMREKIIPTAKYYPLEDLIRALDQHSNMCLNGRGVHAKRKRSMIEYVMCK